MSDTYPRYILSAEVMSQFTPVLNSKGQWVIKLAPNRYLHFIEPLDNTPITSNRSDMTMVSFNFIEEAEGIIKYLQQLWSGDMTLLNKHNDIPIVVDVERNKKLKAGG